MTTADGTILLSMDVSFGKRGKIMARPSVHLFLAGVVNMEAINVADKLDE